MTTLSVVVVSYRRRERLTSILEGWLRETPDVWLCDCGEIPFKADLPVHFIHASPDPGNRIRHAIALMTSGDLVIKADDDISPLPGLGAEFIAAHKQWGDAIYGIHGRIFTGSNYYGQTLMVGAGKTKKITAVDFVGVITAAPRVFLPMDLNGCRSEYEDLFWQMKCFPNAHKYVMPTNNILHLPESFDTQRLCGGPKSRIIRQCFYAEMYNENYRRKH